MTREQAQRFLDRADAGLLSLTERQFLTELAVLLLREALATQPDQAAPWRWSGPCRAVDAVAAIAAREQGEE